MATPTQIAELRRLINQPDNEAPWTDQVLSDMIDATEGDLNKVAGSVWTQKASSYAELVDVQEGSSRRALGSLYEQALAMAKQFGVSDDSTTVHRSRTRQIVRP